MYNCLLELVSCQVFVRFLSESASSSVTPCSKNHLLAPLAADSQFGTHTIKYRPYTEQVFRIIRRWTPEYIPYNSPFIGCLLLGPAAIHLRATFDGSKNKNARCIEADLLKLTLAHVARFWKIGIVLEGKASHWLCNLTYQLTCLTRPCEHNI